MAKFELGQLVATRGVYEKMCEDKDFFDFVNESMCRFESCDWGDMCSENDAVKFLYCYNNKPLSEIMDTEIRARVESKFVEECASRTLNDILVEKEKIMEDVRNDVVTYFSERGITITVLGMKDGLEYDDTTIQKSINDKFSSEMKLTTQKNENERIISEAEAKAEANRILSESLTDEVLKQQMYEKWDGKLPEVMTGSDNGVIVDFGNG